MPRKRIIQVPMDEGLLEELDALGKKSGRARAGLIREAVARYVADRKTEELDRIYEEGYRKFPEDLSWAEAQVKLLPEVWGEESW